MLSSNQPHPALSSLERNEYVLTKLEKMITTEIEMIVDRNYHFEADTLSDFRVEVKIVSETIKNALDLHVQQNDEKAVENYVQFHQRALIRLAGFLARYVDGRAGDDETVRYVVECLYQEVQELLEFIRKRFPRYYAPDAWVPGNYRQMVSNAVRPRVTTLKQNLLGYGVDPKLVQIALSKLELLGRSDDGDLAYSEVAYLMEYVLQISKFHPDDDPTTELVQLLIYLNYNSFECYQYIIRQTMSAADEMDSENARAECLNLVKKELNQTAVKPHAILNPNKASLKDQLGSWLDEEIRFCELRTRTELTGSEDGTQADSPYKTELTVAEIAYFLKVLIELGIIKATRRIARILQFIARYFATDNTDSISLQSLSNKYSKPEGKTMESLKAILLRMVNRIDADIDRIYGMKK